jgi:hypothetical protein
MYIFNFENGSIIPLVKPIESLGDYMTASLIIQYLKNEYWLHYTMNSQINKPVQNNIRIFICYVLKLLYIRTVIFYRKRLY